MYKILIKTCSASNNIWNFYQEDGVDYVAASLEDMKPTALTLLKKYGKKNIKIIDQMSGQDMDNADVYIYDSTDNYEELSNRPYINGTEIVGQLTLEDLGIQPAGDYLNQNDLEEIENKINNMDLSAYATNTRVDEVEAQIENIDLTPYATKEFVSEEISNIDIPETDLSGYATEEYVDDAIAGIDIPETDLTDYATIQYVDDSIANIDNPDTIPTVEITSCVRPYSGGTVVSNIPENCTNLSELINTIYQNKYIGPVKVQTPIQVDTKILNPSFESINNTVNSYLYTLTTQEETYTFITMSYYRLPIRIYHLYIEGTWENDIFTCTGYRYEVTRSYNIPTVENVLTKKSPTEFTPTSDYHPATKKYVDDLLANTNGLIDIEETTIDSDTFHSMKTGDVYRIVNSNTRIYYNGTLSISTNYANALFIGSTFPLVIDGNLVTCLVGSSKYVFNMTKIIDADTVLTKTNTTSFTPTGDYNPATKKYVDEAVAGVSGGSGGGADLTNYYTKAEVDALLQELRNEFVSANNNINDKLETIIYGGE